MCIYLFRLQIKVCFVCQSASSSGCCHHVQWLTAAYRFWHACIMQACQKWLYDVQPIDWWLRTVPQHTIFALNIGIIPTRTMCGGFPWDEKCSRIVLCVSFSWEQSSSGRNDDNISNMDNWVNLVNVLTESPLSRWEAFRSNCQEFARNTSVLVLCSTCGAVQLVSLGLVFR